MQEALTDEINYLSAAYPFELFNRNMIVSLNYQYLYEFDRTIKANFVSYSTGSSIRFAQHMNFKQRGKLSALSPAYAIQITPDLSLGVTCNIWTDKLFWSNGWTSDTRIKGTIGRAGKAPAGFKAWDHDRYHGFSGFNMNLGFLWDINRFIRIGAVLKTPFTGELTHERTVTSRVTSSIGGSTSTTLHIREDVDLHMPMSYGAGCALRCTDAFTVSFDIFRTEWSKFKLEDAQGSRMNPVTGQPTRQSRTYATHQVRLGAEYLFVLTKTVIPVRCGLFYDPEPSTKSPEDFWGFSAGSGISLGKFICDFAYQFRMGKDVEGDVLSIPSAHADVKQHLFLTSFIYHF
jgi:long-subunit fatty acid transport protein